MPTARETLLDAALVALEAWPWAAVRMVDVAEAAEVSRQTLYNEFGSKEGLARALARREADTFLDGAEHALLTAERHGADAGDRFAAATAWTLRAARRNPLVRAALTGCRGERLPAAVLSAGPAPRRADRKGPAAPAPGELVGGLRDRAADALGHGYPKLDSADIGWVCEVAARLSVSYVIAPARSDEDACRRVASLVRGLLPPGGP